MTRKGYILPLALVACVLLAAFGVARARARIQATNVSDCVQLYINGTVVYESAVCGTKTATATPAADATATPDATVTPPPIGDDHDVVVWHPPAGGHHHGGNPRDAHSAIVAFLDTHPDFVRIGHPWQSSPTENVYPYPDGKHVGFANLIENDTGCQTSVRGEGGGNCVAAYYLQVHSIGTADALRTRIHSDKIVALVCDEADGQCGIVATGGHADYGIMHSQYKDTICPDADNPDLPAQYQFQPPYRTVNGSDRSAVLWSSNINALVESHLPDPDPNQRLQLVWSERPWSVPALGASACLDSSVDVSTGRRQTEFQVFSIHLEIEDLPRPFDGFTDVHGHLRDDCAAAGPNCVPLHVGAGVPVGDFSLLRSVRIGNGDAAPILTYGADAVLVQPGAK